MTTVEILEMFLQETGGVLRYDPTQGMFRLEYKKANTYVDESLDNMARNIVHEGVRQGRL